MKVVLTIGSMVALGAVGLADEPRGKGVPPDPEPVIPKEIRIDGSDTMLQLGLSLAEAYKGVRPNVSILINGEGSGTGIKALIQGKSDLAHSSRPMKDSEKAAFKKEYGFEPREQVVAYDVIGIYVHPDNPAKALSMAQLRNIYAEDGGADKWGDVGVDLDQEIAKVGRNNTSGTCAFFKKAVLERGEEFASGIATLPGSTALVEFVASNPAAIGYTGIGYRNETVKCLAITGPKGKAFEPTNRNLRNGSYPLRRKLYIYRGAKNNEEIDRYLNWLKSAAAQKLVRKEGFTQAH